MLVVSQQSRSQNGVQTEYRSLSAKCVQDGCQESLRAWLQAGTRRHFRKGACGSLVVFTDFATRVGLNTPLWTRCVLRLSIAHEPPTIGLARRCAFSVAYFAGLLLAKALHLAKPFWIADQRIDGVSRCGVLASGQRQNHKPYANHLHIVLTLFKAMAPVSHTSSRGSPFLSVMTRSMKRLRGSEGSAASLSK